MKLPTAVSMAFGLLVATTVAAQQVVSEKIVLAKGPSPAFQLTETVVLGSMSGVNDAFGRVMGVTFDSSGRIFVADDKNHRVSVFSTSGSLIRHLGRLGRGPEEFDSPWKVAVDGNDSLFVWDAGQSRVTVFTPKLTYARDFRLPPQWVVNSMRFLPDGRLLIAAYGREEPSAIHISDRKGSLQRTFGPKLNTGNLAGFEASLLGGHVDVGEGRIVYSNKSPYQIRIYDLNGNLLRVCSGAKNWTTEPSDVVVKNERGDGLRWNKYIHSSNIIALPENRYLNITHDPVNDREVLDLLTSDCKLLKRTVIDVPIHLSERLGDKILGVRNLDYPEVIVYRMSVAQ